MLYGSRDSTLAISLYKAIASSTVLTKPPPTQYGWDALYASGREYSGIEPNPALKPTTLQQDAGTLREPPASPPSAIGIKPSAIAAADPPDDPPELYNVLTPSF